MQNYVSMCFKYLYFNFLTHRKIEKKIGTIEKNYVPM